MNQAEWEAEQKKGQRQYRSMVNNAQGHYFEKFIQGGCNYYYDNGIAVVHQTPEPFRVIKKYRNGTALVQFTANAQPDFTGVISEGKFKGRSIVFEAKFTTTEKMHKNVLTATQTQILQAYYESGAASGVVCGIKDLTYFLPWVIWRDMRELFGHQYVTQKDVESFRVKFNGIIHFMHYVYGGREKWYALNFEGGNYN